MSRANNFDFLVGTWNILNKRKTGTSFWADHEPEEEAVWEEFPAVDLACQCEIDEKIRRTR